MDSLGGGGGGGLKGEGWSRPGEGSGVGHPSRQARPRGYGGAL